MAAERGNGRIMALLIGGPVVAALLAAAGLVAATHLSASAASPAHERTMSCVPLLLPTEDPMNFQQALKDPGKAFSGSPEAVERSDEFDATQKRAILVQWKDQLTQLAKATEENMPGPESNGAGAECLRRVVDALTRLST